MVQSEHLVAMAFLVAGLIVAAIYLPLAGRKGDFRTGALKTVPVALFAMASITGGGPAFLSVALILSAVGDFVLSRPGRAAFLYGLCAFALAHLLFILCFRFLGDSPLWEAFANAPLAALGLILLALSTELWLAPHTGRLVWPVRGYIVLITGMGLAALVVPSAMWLVTLGAGMFIVSDLILSLRLFRMADDSAAAPLASRALWVFYIGGQVLIVGGILAV